MKPIIRRLVTPVALLLASAGLAATGTSLAISQTPPRTVQADWHIGSLGF